MNETFDPTPHLISLQGKPYLPVAYRLLWFRNEHPDWGIKTEAMVLDTDGEKPHAVFRAIITDDSERILSTGTKCETLKGFGDFIEKAETGAIGRALGMLGYGTQFAPEFDEGKERIVDAPNIPAGRNHSAPPPPGQRLDPMRAIHAIAKEKGLSHEDIRALALPLINTNRSKFADAVPAESMSELTPRELENLRAWLDRTPAETLQANLQTVIDATTQPEPTPEPQPERPAVSDASAQSAAALNAQDTRKTASSATLKRLRDAATKAGYTLDELDEHVQATYGRPVVQLTNIDALELTHEYNQTAAQLHPAEPDESDPYANTQEVLI